MYIKSEAVMLIGMVRMSCGVNGAILAWKHRAPSRHHHSTRRSPKLTAAICMHRRYASTLGSRASTLGSRFASTLGSRRHLEYTAGKRSAPVAERFRETQDARAQQAMQHATDYLMPRRLLQSGQGAVMGYEGQLRAALAAS